MQMTKNLQTLLQSELYGATNYIEHLIHALTKITELDHLGSVRKISGDLNRDLYHFLNENLVAEKFARPLPSEESISLKSTAQTLEDVKALLLAMIRLGVEPYNLVHTTAEFINMAYQYAHELHTLVAEHTELEVQFPRLNLIEVYGEMAISEDEEMGDEYAYEFSPENEEGSASLPLFYLNAESIKQCAEGQSEGLGSLESQRGRKYEDLLAKGHEAVFHKRHEDALEKFQEASEYRETAEVLTLIGWVYSLMGQYEPAKSHCLRAIRKDPDYGPPYNDLGSYLLGEGQVDESLRWFELAKKSPVYQNREYPYINSGRAFIAKRQYEKALEEFSKALSLAPYHQELQQTVDKLKQSLKKKEMAPEDGRPNPLN